jgi:hypothetical protein
MLRARIGSRHSRLAVRIGELFDVNPSLARLTFDSLPAVRTSQQPAPGKNPCDLGTKLGI